MTDALAPSEDFPILARDGARESLVYLDSAATALKPRSVIAALVEYYERFPANVHRGRHRLSEDATQAFEAARDRIASHLSVDPSCVIFVAGATDGLSLVASSLSLSRDDDKVLVPISEHHSNVMPWMRHARVEVLEADPFGPLTPAALEEAIQRVRPRVVAFSWAGNVTGCVNPVDELCQVARAHGVLSVVDGAQGFGHGRPPSEHDFLCFSAHKALGPTGIGVLTGRREALERLDPARVGGGALRAFAGGRYELKELPHRLESGTPHIAGARGLAAAIEYLDDLGWDAITSHGEALARVLRDGASSIPGVTVLGAAAPEQLAIATLVFDARWKASCDQLAMLLSDRSNVMVRSGSFCAQPLFARTGHRTGLRASAHVYNGERDIARFVDALSALGRHFS